MTNEEAISIMKVIVYMLEPQYNTDRIEDAVDVAIKALEQTRWIPCSKRLPKENEYIKGVRKYYLIQDEYGNMHVAHLSNVGWIPLDTLKAIGDEVIAWMPLPEPYKEDDNDNDK